MRSKVLDVLPMMCDRSGADVVFPGGAAAVDEDYWFGDADAERKERKERNLKNQSNETAAKEERTRDCYRSREEAQIHCLPTSWLVECFAA